MQRLKRFFDFTAATAALVLLSPLLVAAMLLVRVRLGSPVIYRAERIGLGNRVFTLYKLRSMTDAADASGEPLPDEQRLTRLGAFLRKTSLDELPSLLNVLRGEMSLVGPRPFSSLYMGRYTTEQNRRHDVLPGITGWSQINGRNNLPWEERFALDLWYIDHWTFALDLKILALTVAQVITRRDVNTDGHVTSPEFMGTSAVDERAGAEGEAAR